MKSLKDDPEMGEIFNELEAGGPAAMMKYWNNPEVLKKLGETMGGVFDFQVRCFGVCVGVNNRAASTVCVL
jgi:hypothetical protein